MLQNLKLQKPDYTTQSKTEILELISFMAFFPVSQLVEFEMHLCSERKVFNRV